MERGKPQGNLGQDVRRDLRQDLPQEEAEPGNMAVHHGPGEASQEAARNEAAPDAAVGHDPAGHELAPCNLVVDIYDQMYHLRGPDPKYLEQLSALVDAKMRAVAQHGTTVDSLRVAVLAALNIADELVTLQQQREALAGTVALNIKSRTEILAEMLDAALDANRKAG